MSLFRLRVPQPGFLRIKKASLFILVLLLLAAVSTILAAGKTGGYAKSLRGSDKIPSSVGFVGDSYTSGTPIGGVGSRNYTSILGSRIHTRVYNGSVGGTGYVEKGTGEDSFVTQFRRLAAVTTPEAVVVVGSRNDVRYSPALVKGSVLELIRSVHELAPRARLVLIGPVIPVGADSVGGDVLATRDAVRAGAIESGEQFYDPIAERWLDRSVIGADGVHPTDLGHARLAQNVERVLAGER